MVIVVKKFYILLFFVLCFLFIDVKAETVRFNKCIDGDTSVLSIDGEVKKIRFLAVDTPETKHPTKGEEPFGKEASNFTCSSLKKASEISLEYEKDMTDKYDRILAWVFVDGELLQSKLIKKGYAKVAYLYGDYKYTDDLRRLESVAKKEKVGIWGDYKEDYSQYIYLGCLVLMVIIYCILDKKYRRKTINKVKKKTKKELEKQVNKLFK